MSKETVWSYNDQEFELDMLDAATAEHYESTLASFEDREKSLPKVGKTSEIIRAYCQFHFDLFDAMLGEGASAKLFGGRMNIRTCDEAYESFLDFVSGQSKGVVERRQAFYSKYSPNRAQRRAAERK